MLVSVRFPVKLPAEAGANPILKDAEAPGATESGKVNPDTLKPVPLTVACVTLRVAVPGFCTVMVCVLVTPTVTFPKLTADGVTVIKGFTPVPLKEMLRGELVALLVTAMLPVALPETAGVKVTLNDVLCPAAKVTGKAMADRLKPVPLAAICEMLTLEFPLFVKVTACVCEAPPLMDTFPKFTAVGFAESCNVEATPLPLNGKEAGELVAVLTTVTLPVKLLTLGGVNVTLIEVFCPGASVTGPEKPPIPKPVPEALTCDTVTEPVPVLVSVNGNALVVPTT